jgi:hypothetical protein
VLVEQRGSLAVFALLIEGLNNQDKNSREIEKVTCMGLPFLT